MDSDKDKQETALQPARRRFVGTVAAGLAAAQAAAQNGASTSTSNAAPASRSLTPPSYAKPPFPRQQQAWPGLTGKMTPRPDHGETSYRGSGRLLGRRALITGGDSGIGRAAAIAFAREGADVAINYLPAEEPDAREVVALIRQAGRNAVALPGDIRDEGFCKRLVADAVHQLGGLDILVNNAARQHSVESILDLTTAELDWHFKTNLYAPFWITKAAIPHMPPGGAIIVTASVQAYEPSPNHRPGLRRGRGQGQSVTARRRLGDGLAAQARALEAEQARDHSEGEGTGRNQLAEGAGIVAALSNGHVVDLQFIVRITMPRGSFCAAFRISRLLSQCKDSTGVEILFWESGETHPGTIDRAQMRRTPSHYPDWVGLPHTRR